MEVTNSWIKGMNKDLDPLIIPSNTYQHAENFRLITENGGTTSSLTNIRGNEIKFKIPNTKGIHIISVGTFGNVNITLQGQVGSTPFVTSSSTTPEDIYNYVTTNPNYTRCLQNPNAVALNFNSYYVYYNLNYVFIVGAITASFVMNTITGSVSNGNLVFTSNFIPAQSSLYIIGQGYIRDNIYILTTSDFSRNPGGHDPNFITNTTSLGQIWELSFNQVTEVAVLKLLYNNYVDFTAQHPVPPTAIRGRYENSDTQRIYWTDNFNKLRSFNVKDPNGFGLDVSLLDVRPSIDFSVPILQKIISGGVLQSGVYQLLYRLKNTGGAVSKVSPMSNLVNITSSSEDTATGGGNFSTYIGDPIGINTGKAIMWKIQDIDLDYDRIEYIAVFRNVNSSIPASIGIVGDEPIPGSGEVTFTFTGNENIVTLTLDDISAIDDTFTHCKTIETKDNRLFAGNVRQNTLDIDYDARAFRAKTSGLDNIYLTNGGVQTLYNSTTARALAVTEDTINDYTNVNAGYYKPNTAIIGGSGTNISYEFGTIAVRADNTIEPAASMTGAPIRHTNPDFTIGDLDLGVKRIDSINDQKYSMNSINDDIKYPYYASLFKGYERGEIYRFAITFFDKAGNPVYSKWIGDIKFPQHSDPCPAANSLYENFSQTGLTDYRLSFVSGSNEAFVNQLFIKFEVKIPDSISNIVSGYRICRVERTQANKTILATGFLNTVVSDGGGNDWLPDVQTDSVSSGFPYLNIDPNTSVSGEARESIPTLDAPEFLLGGFPGFTTGDSIKVVSRLTIGNTIQQVQINGVGEPYNMYKYYNIDSLTSYSFDLEEAGVCETGDTYTFTGASNTGETFHNVTRSTTNTSDAIGSRTLCLGLSIPVDFAAKGCTETNGKKFIAQYIRTVASQYGGNTYTDRTLSEYIPCSHFRPIKNYVTSAGTIDDFYLFGGDVYTQAYDNQKEIKNWGYTPRGQYSGAGYSKTSVTFFYPTSSTHNTDLRHGIHVNHNLDNDTGSNASGYETYDYNTVYSSENNIINYFPKPSQISDSVEYDNSVWASELKIDGELVDSWGIFKIDNVWYVEGSYGPINGLQVLQDKMFLWQTNAFGTLSINPRVLVTDANNTSIQLGTGGVIERHDYISTERGCKHQWSIINSPTSLLWWDANVRKIMRFNESLQQLSDVKGLRGYLYEKTGDYLLNNDNPIYTTDLTGLGCGIHGVYDYRYNEFIITFLNGVNNGRAPEQNPFTVVFNEEIDAFTGFYTYYPNIYITNHREIYSNNVQTAADVYLHDRGDLCSFYGGVHDSLLTTVVNSNPQYTKVFDNFNWNDNSISSTGINITNNTWKSIRVYNSYQNTDTISLIIGSNVKRKDRSWKYAIGRNRVLYSNANQNADIFNDLSLSPKEFGERIRDKYIYADFTYDNTQNYNYTFKLLNTTFRPSYR